MTLMMVIGLFVSITQELKPDPALAQLLAATEAASPSLPQAAARIAQLNIMDAVFVAVAQRNYRAAEQNLQRTMSAVNSKRKDRMP